jgi:hypothetical protein
MAKRMSQIRRNKICRLFLAIMLLQRTRAWSAPHPLFIDNKLIQNVMAAMVAASDYAFPCLVEQYGADLTFTQMLHTRNIVEVVTFAPYHLDFPFRQK